MVRAEGAAEDKKRREADTRNNQAGRLLDRRFPGRSRQDL